MNSDYKTTLKKALIAQGNKRMAEALVTAVEEGKKKANKSQAPSTLMIAIKRRKEKQNISLNLQTEDINSDT